MFSTSNPEEIITRLDGLKQFLKECKYPEHVISRSIFNAKRLGPAPSPEKSKKVIPFVTNCCPNIDNKSLMQTVKNKLKNIRNEHLKSLYVKIWVSYCLWENQIIYIENWHLLDSYNILKT